MFFKVVATFLKIVLFYLKRYCIWLNDALYVAGTFCATCFFLPEVLYLVRYEMGLWIKECIFTCWKKTQPDRNLEIYFQEKWLSAKECYLLKRNTLLLEGSYTLWMKVFVCKACSCQLELVLQEKDACLIVSAFFRSGEKTQSWFYFFFKCGLNHYLRETLQRGGGTRRHVNYT